MSKYNIGDAVLLQLPENINQDMVFTLVGIVIGYEGKNSLLIMDACGVKTVHEEKEVKLLHSYSKLLTAITVKGCELVDRAEHR